MSVQAESLELVSRSREETERIGAALGVRAEPGDVFLLVGELGAGKTCLVQGVAVGLGVPEHTRSPTFILASSYQGRHRLHHIDLYRVEIDEIPDLGLDEYLSGRGVSVVEWANKALLALPPEHLLISLEHLDESSRYLRLKAQGERYRQLLSELALELAPFSTVQ